MKGNFVLYKILNQYQFSILPINIGTKFNKKKNARVFVSNFKNVIYLHAYNILLINVDGLVVLGVSIIYATAQGYVAARASVMIAPDADHVKISIWPGVSMII